MKKITLSDLYFDEPEQLTREQLKNLMGGSANPPGGGGEGTVTSAACLNWTGEWYYTSPVTYAQCHADVDIYCPFGGSCHGQ